MSPVVGHFIVLKREFLEGYRDVIVEMDNLMAYRDIKNFSIGAQAQVFDILSQIDICIICDPRWFCVLSFVFPARNRVARYAARVEMELGDRIYTLDMSVTGVEELMGRDMGVGQDHLNYVDIVLLNNATDPSDFNSSLILADNIENM